MLTAGVAGDGIAGLLLAFSLYHAGWQVTLFSAGNKHSCSSVAAGLLSPVAELDKNDLIIFQLGLSALHHHWPGILNKLNKKIYFKQLGSLLLSHPKDKSDINRFINIIDKKLSNKTYYQLLNQVTISELEPEMQHFANGYFFPVAGQINSQRFINEMTRYLKQKIHWIDNAKVSDVKPHLIKFNQQANYFDMVFDCRGLGAKSTFTDLRSIRGELIWLHAPDVHIQRPIRFVHPRYHLYLVPREKQIYLLGASEIESNDYSRISVRTTLELLTAVYSIQEKFVEARIIKTATQCRPTLMDHLPKIKYADGYIAMNGLYRHGFLIAPSLVADLMQWMHHGKSYVQYPQLFEKIEV